MIKKRGEIKEEDHGNFARVDPKETIYLLALADKEDSGVNLTAKFVEVRLPNSVIALLIGCFIMMILLLTLCSIMIGVICKQCSRVVMEQNDSNVEPPNIEVQERVKSNMDNESQVESPPFTKSDVSASTEIKAIQEQEQNTNLSYKDSALLKIFHPLRGSKRRGSNSPLHMPERRSTRDME